MVNAGGWPAHYPLSLMDHPITARPRKRGHGTLAKTRGNRRAMEKPRIYTVHVLAILPFSSNAPECVRVHPR